MTHFSARTAARWQAAVRIKHPDAVVALRGKLLNIIALAFLIILPPGLVYIILMGSVAEPENILRAGVAAAISLGLLGVILVLNRRGFSRVAAWLFLLGLLALVAFSDTPAHLIEGRSTILFSVPIVIASAVAVPPASFLLAALSGIVLYGLAWGTGLVWHPLALSIPVTTSVFFIMALVSWLTTRRLEHALETVQGLNHDLEQRVAVRTRELTTANQQLQVANERLIAHDRLRRAFVSMVSHDLRSPLVGILSNTEMLGLNVYGEMSDKQRGAVKRMAHNTRSLLRLVNDLLDQTQIEAGQLLTLHPSRFSPADLLAETVSAIGDLAQAKGLELTTHLSGDMPPSLWGDPQRLLQILINLTANAIKFTDAGWVRVEISYYDERRWVIRVRDTGRGIPVAEQPHIFEPFRRGGSAGASAGAGLGLSIVKHLVDLMSGEIQMTSEEQHGSNFTVILPFECPAGVVQNACA